MDEKLYIDVIIKLKKKLPKWLATKTVSKYECCYSQTKLSIHDNFEVTVEENKDIIDQFKEQVKARFYDIQGYVQHYGVFSKMTNCYFN